MDDINDIDLDRKNQLNNMLIAVATGNYELFSDNYEGGDTEGCVKEFERFKKDQPKILLEVCRYYMPQMGMRKPQLADAKVGNIIINTTKDLFSSNEAKILKEMGNQHNVHSLFSTIHVNILGRLNCTMIDVEKNPEGNKDFELTDNLQDTGDIMVMRYGRAQEGYNYTIYHAVNMNGVLLLIYLSDYWKIQSDNTLRVICGSLDSIIPLHGCEAKTVTKYIYRFKHANISDNDIESKAG